MGGLTRAIGVQGASLMQSMNIYPLPELVYIPIREWIEDDTVILIKQDHAWQALQPATLDWDIGIELDAPVPTEQAYERLKQRCEGMGEVIYAVGGGRVVDAAKFVAHALELPLIAVPTALSADAFFTPSSAVRRDGGVRSVETIPPEIVLLDLDVIAAAPARVRAAGICDVLSIATAGFDWALSEQRGRNPPGERFDPRIAGVARSLLDVAMDCAEAAGRGAHDALRQLVSALVMEVQWRNLIGHSRPQAGSEHHFAECAEMLTGAASWRGDLIPAPYAHAELVGPGIVLMAERQGQDAALLRRALELAGVPMDALPADVIAETLRQLPAYVRRHNLPYGIAWEL